MYVCIYTYMYRGLLYQPLSLLNQPQTHHAGTWLIEKEEQGIRYASSFVTFQLTTRDVQILIDHVTKQHAYVVILTSVWPN